MQAPRFWNRAEPTILSRSLKPLSLLYGAIAGARMRCQGKKVGVKVLCVGNFTLGGAGKTPLAIWLAENFQLHNIKIIFVSRGYGGAMGKGPVVVDPKFHSAREVGDEPLLLARYAPVVIGSDRIACADLAGQMGADLVILDDGLQNPSLHKDLSIVVVDAKVGIGNGEVFPAGPLRASLFIQWQGVDACVTIGQAPRGMALDQQARDLGKFTVLAQITSDKNSVEQWQGKRVLGFAGIARPDKFFDSLEKAGVILAERHSFADHYFYSKAELDLLVSRAIALNAALITTEKDFVRLEETQRPDNLFAWPISLKLDNSDAFLSWLKLRLFSTSQAH